MVIELVAFDPQLPIIFLRFLYKSEVVSQFKATYGSKPYP